MDDKCSEYLLSEVLKGIYRISGVEFSNALFHKVRRDELTAQEVFAITNMEQRRIAYQKMAKIKMKELPDLKILHEVEDDGHGYPMKIISFTWEDYGKPFTYLNCFCPSEGREYYLECFGITDCWEAKAASFGFKEDEIEWEKEW